MVLNLPNQITLGRLILTIIFFVLLAQYDCRAPNPGLMHVAFWLFVGTALTDVLDGYLARRHNLVTSFGRIMDPFVDKILVCGVFTFFLGQKFVDGQGRSVTDVQAWMVVVILGRELLVTSLRSVFEVKGIAFAATFYGKLKMLVQSITAGIILFSLAFEATAIGWLAITIRPVAVWLTVIVTVISMLVYLRRAKGLLTEQIRA